MCLINNQDNIETRLSRVIFKNVNICIFVNEIKKKLHILYYVNLNVLFDK